MRAKKIIIGITALLALAITSLGCYTIIKHPAMTVEQETDDSSSSYSHGDADRDCMRCHQDYGTYPYGYYYGYYPDYYWSNPNWGSYYAYPWWWEEYWYSDKSGGGASVPVDTVDQVSQPDRRRGIAPPYSRGADPILNPPPFNSGNTTPTVGGTGGTTTGGGAIVTPPANTDDGKKEEQKPPRRRGK
ncbi:MAG: hypothetical protein WBP29_04010 [Candidatus Zixiibacteriota bacterium]